MKIEVRIIARGKSDKAIESLTDVVNSIRSGSFQREGSDEDIKVKATVVVLEK